MSDLVVHSTPEFDPGYNVRTTLLRAAFDPEKPPPDIHLRLITWSRAAATNTLKAVATDLKIVEALQASRYRPTLPLTPLDLYMLTEERARAGIGKSSIDRLFAYMVLPYRLIDLPSPVAENPWSNNMEIGKITN